MRVAERWGRCHGFGMNKSIPSRVAVSSGVVDADVGGEKVLLHTGSSTYFGLDETGSLIWDHLKQGDSLPKIIDLLVATYGISADRAKVDLNAFLGDLAEHRIVNLDPPAG